MEAEKRKTKKLDKPCRPIVSRLPTILNNKPFTMSTEAVLFIAYLGTLLLVVIYGMLAWSHIAVAYRPMIVFILAIFVLQIIETFFQVDQSVKTTISQLEPLFELVLILWQAKRWRLFDRRPKVFWLILLLAAIAWVMERIWATEMPMGVSWFSAVSSFMIILVAIEILTRTMITSPSPVFRNPIFLFSVALIFYYTFSGLLDLFILVSRYSGEGIIYKGLYFYLALGIVTNIIYLQSFKCIPQKTNYSIS
jgi:hypothetical protein